MIIRSNPTENAILELLVAAGSLSVQDIQHSLHQQHAITISLPQLYKILQKMTKEYILVRKYGTVMLNAYRINQIDKEVQQLKQAITPPNTTDIIKHGTTRYYHASSIQEQETIRIDLTAKILQNQQPTDLYFYDSHLYYVLGFFDTSTVYDPHLPPDGRMYYLLGNNTILDQHAQTLITSKRTRFAHSNASLFAPAGYSLRVLGDYIIEIYIPDTLHDTFQEIYSHTQSLKDFDQNTFSGLFRIKTKTTFRITHNRTQAQELATYVRKFFV